ncbi:uncharacterized protein TOT_040000939 [Theileria orientalis strain Shintoku]|uniref:Sphingomyelin synthase-like domain-containing protein n=1 Tax=Theileria orientalis strain Shintoku TaxID=869250 RepID=J4DQ66_THEOR|nr:uncharacterized protein TOT_040000939 [Theileria orientalis strain Shintoku]PVC51333.1 hypothetical protein MACL_00001615 [Theileria orientalis]BAM41919.1 uncharacterized protein TOT_040000939 [Theileria orientalis strain Shintoku]|eukprot:XP_009692220.1 uncharacterized protein TOT_040000939 [Theileria orientalis strain Shintoku]
MGILRRECAGQKLFKKSESPDVTVTMDEWTPFTVDENTDVEAEVKQAIKEYIRLDILLFLRLVLTGVYVVAVIFIICFSMYFSDLIYLKTSRVPVPDRFHEILDRFKHPFNKLFCDILMQLFFSAAVIRLAFFATHLYVYHVAIRIVLFIGTGNLIKSIFIIVTTIPACQYNCNPQLHNVTYRTLFLRFFQGITGIVDNCTDLIISGHSLYTIYTCVLLYENTRNVAVRVISVLYAAFVLFLIVASKYHYVVDVIFGLFIAWFMHYFYYSTLDDYGVYLYNKIYHSKSKKFQEMRVRRSHEGLFTKFLANLEMLEERMVLGQKMRTLYLLVNSEKNLIDPMLLRNFKIVVHLFGAYESDDITTLYRGTKKFDLYYWKTLYDIAKKKGNVQTH